jgi:hypothetical protein
MDAGRACTNEVIDPGEAAGALVRRKISVWAELGNPPPAFAGCEGFELSRASSSGGATRPMRRGNIVSPWHYEAAAACHTLDGRFHESCHMRAAKYD